MSLISDNGGQCERILGDNWQSINFASTIEDSSEEEEAAFRALAGTEQANLGNDEIISLSFPHLWNFAHFPASLYLRHYSWRIILINLYFFHRNRLVKSFSDVAILVSNLRKSFCIICDKCLQIRCYN